jgi:hypothetical protein
MLFPMSRSRREEVVEARDDLLDLEVEVEVGVVVRKELCKRSPAVLVAKVASAVVRDSNLAAQMAVVVAEVVDEEAEVVAVEAEEAAVVLLLPVGNIIRSLGRQDRYPRRLVY